MTDQRHPYAVTRTRHLPVKLDPRRHGHGTAGGHLWRVVNQDE